MPKSYLDEFVNEAIKRETQGLATYGEFDPETDRRNLCHEAREEVIDVLNYMRFLQRRSPELKGQINQIKALAYSLYVLLRRLEKREDEILSTLNKGGGI